MNTMIHPQQLSDEINSAMRERFEADPRIRELRVRATRLQQSGYFSEALKVNKEIERLYDRVVVSYCSDAEDQFEQFSMDTLNMPQEDKVRIVILMTSMYMAVDIMDSCLMDINDTLHRTDKTLNYENISELKNTAHLCREQMKMFGSIADYTKYADWGDITDNMYEMMQKKAKSIIRKTDSKRKKG